MTAAAVTHGQLTVRVSATNEVSQPGTAVVGRGPAGQTVPFSNAEISC